MAPILYVGLFPHKQKDNTTNNNKKQINYTNKPYDEAFEISQDLSMAESYDGREKV